MSKKISFSSVLQNKTLYEQSNSLGLPSLASFVQEYVYNPNGNYTLALGQKNMKKYRRNNSRRDLSQIGFQQGLTPLEVWINSQSSQSRLNHQNQFNKQNSISNVQYGRVSTTKQSPYKGVKSPAKNLLRDQQTGQKTSKNVFNGQTRNRNLSMNQLSKIYVENKNSQISNYSEQEQEDGNQPVWKFSSQNGEEDSMVQNNIDINSRNQEERRFQAGNTTKNYQNDTCKPQFYRQIHNGIQEYQANPMLSEQENRYLENQYENLKKIEIQKNISLYPTPQNPRMQKEQNIRNVIEKIKANLSSEIQNMAYRIIEEREAEKNKSIKDQQMLISQRQSQSQEQKRKKKKMLQNLQSQIKDYMKIKCDSKISGISNQIEKSQKQIKSQLNDQNSGVGYSFASDFNSKITSNIKLNQNSKVEMEKHKQEIQSENKISKPFIEMKKSMQNHFRLPNIDQVRSQQDYNDHQDQQKMNEYFNERNKPNNDVMIDKNCVKQIQSVAYGYYADDKKRQIYQDLPPVEGRPSLNERVTKLSMSMSNQKGQNEKFKNSLNQDGFICNNSIKNHQRVYQELKSESITKKMTSIPSNKNLQLDNINKSAYEQNSSSFNYPNVADNKVIKNQTQINTTNQVTQAKKQPAEIKQCQTQFKKNQLNLHESNKNINSNFHKQSSTSSNKRLLKITLSPKYHQIQENNVTVTSFGDQLPNGGATQKNESIKQINSSSSNHIKLQSYFGNKKIEQKESRQLISKEPMIKNLCNESRKMDYKISIKNSIGPKESMRSVKSSANDDKFQFDLDF